MKWKDTALALNLTIIIWKLTFVVKLLIVDKGVVAILNIILLSWNVPILLHTIHFYVWLFSRKKCNNCPHSIVIKLDLQNFASFSSLLQFNVILKIQKFSLQASKKKVREFQNSAGEKLFWQLNRKLGDKIQMISSRTLLISLSKEVTCTSKIIAFIDMHTIEAWKLTNFAKYTKKSPRLWLKKYNV